jgi:hypothetical protein
MNTRRTRESAVFFREPIFARWAGKRIHSLFCRKVLARAYHGMKDCTGNTGESMARASDVVDKGDSERNGDGSDRLLKVPREEIVRQTVLHRLVLVR